MGFKGPRKKYIGFALLALLLVGIAVSWSWTYTPHGRLDYRAALSLHLLTFDRTFQPDPESDFEMTMPVNLAYALSRMLPEEEVAKTRDVSIQGDGVTVPARVYWPRGWQENGPPRPVIVYYHGGGFVVGSVDLFDPLSRSLANVTEAIVVSVDYRLAPEHPWPAAVKDAYSAVRWVARNAGELGADPSRLLVGGDSAGGNLAAVTALKARNEGGPPIAGQILYYPGTDLGETDYDSVGKFSDGYGLSSQAMAGFSRAYLGHVDDKSRPYISPIYADSHRGLPPALVVTAGFDPLTGSARAYAETLRESGVPVTERHYEGMIHGFLSIGLFHQQREALEATGNFVRDLLPDSG